MSYDALKANVEKLLAMAADHKSYDSHDAVRYSQAALNSAQTLSLLKTLL